MEFSAVTVVRRQDMRLSVVNSTCIQFDYYFSKIFFVLMGLSLALFIVRAAFINRLKYLDVAAYEEIGRPSYSDLFGTKAGRRLLYFLFVGKFRAYDDSFLQISAWLTIAVLMTAEVSMVGVMVALYHCR